MARRDLRVRSGRDCVLDALEDRALLSTLNIPHPQLTAEISAASVPRKAVLSGTVVGTAKSYTPPTKSPLNTQINAKGTAVQVPGAVLVGGFQTTKISGSKVAVSNGVAEFAFPAAGNTYLLVNYSGPGTINTKTAIQTGSFSGNIIGAGGNLAGATGKFTATVSVNGATGAFTLRYSFAITLRA